MESELFAPGQLAEKLGTPVGTLAYWRYQGQGPKFIKIGRNVRYRVSDVDAWLTEQTRTRTDQVASA